MGVFKGKEWKSIDQQVELLKNRGMIIDNANLNRTRKKLEQIGYYRLSGYWNDLRPIVGVNEKYNPYRKKCFEQVIRDDKFIEGASFQHAIDLYIFDKKLRILCLDAIERIEVSLRSRISYYIGRKDPIGYLNKSYIMNSYQGAGGRYELWLDKINGFIAKSKETFIQHNEIEYGKPLAIWVASEVWDFGALSWFYSMLLKEHRQDISNQYLVDDYDIFSSWLISINHLRNICAHHARLWNTNITVRPKIKSKHYKPTWYKSFVGDMGDKKISKVGPLLVIINQILSVVNPKSTWKERLIQHLQTLDQKELSRFGIGFESMGLDKKLNDLILN